MTTDLTADANHRAAPGTATDRSTPARPGRGRGPAAVLAAALAAGLASGAVTSFGQTLLPGAAAGLANAVTPWLVVPFAVGALAASRRWACVAGVVACLAQVGGYHLTADLRGFAVSTTWVLLWCVCALPGGLLAGWAGRSWWHGDGAPRLPGPPRPAAWRRERGLGAALLVAAWLAEAGVTFGLALRYPGHAAVFAAAGALTWAVLGLRGRQHAATAAWLVPALVLGCLGFAALQLL